ncbi:MAG: ABC transporter permease subunit [Chitinivibrionales bacterium]|nr:ABC transporter permease subunit [Chitinivibrionales bacterium]
MRHIRAIVWKELSHIRADPLMVRLIFLPVLAQLFVIGYALTTEVRHTPLAVVDRSRTPQSVSLVQSFTVGELFDFEGYVPSEQQLRTLLDNGVVRMGLVIPASFARSLHRNEGAVVQLLVDGQDANSSQVAGGYAQAIVGRWAMQHLRERLGKRGMDIEQLVPVEVSTTVLYNPLLKSSWYMIPGLVVMLVTIVTSLLTGFSLVREKERGTFEQLLVTPIRPVSLLLGKIAPFVVIGIIEIGMFLLLATLWFGIPFRGSILTLLGFALIYMVSSLGIGILTSTIARTSQQVLFLTWFVLLFFLLLSGWFLPIENMPAWVQGVTYVNPVRFFMTAVRDIFLKGLGFGDLWREALIMAGIGTGVFTLALVSFRRQAT